MSHHFVQPDGRVHGVAVAIPDGDGHLLCVRRSAVVIAPLKVCFPGGGVDADESQEQAVVRECREELGIAVRPLRCIWRWEHPERPLVLFGWLAEYVGGVPRPDPREIAEVIWLSGDEVANHPDGLPSNASFVEALKRDAGSGR